MIRSGEGQQAAAAAQQPETAAQQAADSVRLAVEKRRKQLLFCEIRLPRLTAGKCKKPHFQYDLYQACETSENSCELEKKLERSAKRIPRAAWHIYRTRCPTPSPSLTGRTVIIPSR
eukprot:2456434-Rhodomonas_salina.1